MVLESWTEVTVNSFQSLWEGFIGYLPNIIGALIVFLIGLAIAVGLQKLVVQILRVLRIDPALEKMGTGKFFERAGIKMDLAGWLGGLVKWFLVLVFLMAATDILGLPEVTSFLKEVLLYIPNVIVSVLILLVAVWLANVLKKIVQASVSASSIKAAAFLGTATSWSIMIFAIFGVLIQLGIAPTVIQTLVMGVIAMLALAGGLAFGLGGKEVAAEFLKNLKRELTD